MATTLSHKWTTNSFVVVFRNTQMLLSSSTLWNWLMLRLLKLRRQNLTVDGWLELTFSTDCTMKWLDTPRSVMVGSDMMTDVWFDVINKSTRPPYLGVGSLMYCWQSFIIRMDSLNHRTWSTDLVVHWFYQAATAAQCISSIGQYPTRPRLSLVSGPIPCDRSTYWTQY